MKKLIYAAGFAALLFAGIAGCQKNVASEEQEEAISLQLSDEEKSMIKAAGFNSNWSGKTADGNYLIEGDILLSASQLREMAHVLPAKELIIGNEEHYRTTNLVNTNGGVRTITVSLGSGFPSYYSTALDQVIARYNSYNLNIVFQRVASNGQISITGRRLGTVQGGCILGQAGGFPSGGNPGNGFVLSTSRCATTYLNTANKVDEVMAHEIGHCIGFRHTDYMNRSSCGQNSNEGEAGVGAIHIDGTVFTPPSGSYNSWMMACTNGDNSFSAEDVFALQSIY